MRDEIIDEIARHALKHVDRIGHRADRTIAIAIHDQRTRLDVRINELQRVIGDVEDFGVVCARNNVSRARDAAERAEFAIEGAGRQRSDLLVAFARDFIEEIGAAGENEAEVEFVLAFSADQIALVKDL
jgi:hypothetical protein